MRRVVLPSFAVVATLVLAAAPQTATALARDFVLALLAMAVVVFFVAVGIDARPFSARRRNVAREVVGAANKKPAIRV